MNRPAAVAESAAHAAASAARRTGRHRTPWQVVLLSVLTTLLVAVTSYGAIYFSFFYEDPDPGIGSWVFVAAFLSINVGAAVAVLALLRRSATAWRVLVGYGVVGILWCIAKLVFWHETESLVFGAFNVTCLALLAAPRTRRHVAVA